MASTTLRLPDGLKAEAQAYADRLGVSLNALAAIALRDYLDARRASVHSQPPSEPSPPAGEPAPDLEAKERVRQEMERARARSVVVPLPKVGANQPCPCGSGEKYKRCHGRA